MEIEEEENSDDNNIYILENNTIYEICDKQMKLVKIKSR